VTWTLQVTEIAPGLFVTGAVPRVTDFEAPSSAFCEDMEGREQDLIPDDQALFFKSREGTVVLLGCAHAGVVNTLRRAAHITDARKIHAAIGGMHLHDASATRMRHTIMALAELDVRVIAPGHCTGDAVVARLRQTFSVRAKPYRAGATFEFDLP
jgi:7,8-dihydropterin-6-yl-methyl-4-(beta-D-ribofuranosyl)aminobenzene 5'-phosphate synthase